MSQLEKRLISSVALAVFAVYSSVACLAEGVQPMGDVTNAHFEYLNMVARELKQKLSYDGSEYRNAILRLQAFPLPAKFELERSTGDPVIDRELLSTVSEVVEHNPYAKERTCAGVIAVNFVPSRKKAEVMFSPAPEFFVTTLFYDLSGKPDLGPYKAVATRRMRRDMPAIEGAPEKGVLTFNIVRNGSVANPKIEHSSKDRKLDEQALHVALNQLAFDALPVPGPESIAIRISFGRGSIDVDFTPIYH